MAQEHPYAEAIYAVLPLNDGAFAVEVTIPGGSQPTKVTGLASQAAAEAWIESHKQRVREAPLKRQSWARRSKTPFKPPTPPNESV